MNDEQYKRFRKMNADKLKCLFTKRDPSGNMHFLVSGSTGTRYKVSVYKNGVINCSCPDFCHGCKDNDCVCKHCLHVIYKVLKLFRDVNHKFFERLYFTPDEIQTIKKIYKELKINLKR